MKSKEKDIIWAVNLFKLGLLPLSFTLASNIFLVQASSDSPGLILPSQRFIPMHPINTLLQR